MSGYPQIIRLMSQHEELAILRKFNNLSLQNLLYMQAELMHLEEKYNILSVKDGENPSRSHRSRDWWSLTQPDDDGNCEQWETVLEIRSKLGKYYDQLYKHIFLSSVPKPDSYDLQFFRDWLEGPKMGNFPLRGPDRNAWSENYESDLVAIRRRETGDPFSKWFINTVIPQFHRIVGHRIKKPIDPESQSDITQYSDKRLLSIISVISIVLACVIPISSIIILYFVSSMPARLAILAIFTACFALCLSLVTQARKVEIFAATSAFAAVIVVFLSGNGGQII